MKKRHKVLSLLLSFGFIFIISFDSKALFLDTELLPIIDEQDPIVVVDDPGGSPATTNNLVVQSYETNSSPNYNCYQYALGFNSGNKRNPGYYSPYVYEWDPADGIQAFLEAFFSDMYYLGKTVTPVASTYTPSAGETLICIKFALRPNGTIIDYHFMKYIPSLYGWRHKPGLTSLLRYKYSPDSGAWPCETYTPSSGWNAPQYIYNNQYYYIAYNTSALYYVYS